MFPLLDLPSELWIRICEFAVINKATIEIRDPHFGSSVCAATKQPAITRVSKAIRQESLPLFYKRNEFVIFDDYTEWDGIEEWQRKVGAKYRAHIHGLYITSEYDDIENVLKTRKNEGNGVLIFEIFDEGQPKRLTWNLKDSTYKAIFAAA